ncbi:HD domain-containing phosphohydrolase [Polynucleobacter sp. 71A-WALBACH]|uniref:HD domain-containing phosphohydrolase n=1 Tax=Polynucleobacter sp. 71A-WALBACH TaxID=2689097 RepID=UPI0021021FA3|nr:HD domain-containing phosphohydrolase [Polynucleobacter sp. 71A-WALBACH]
MNQKTVLHEFLSIGASLSSETDIQQLLENIIQTAMRFTNADAGSIYLVQEDMTLNYEIVHTKSRDLHWGGISGTPIDASPISLFQANGEPDLSRVSCYAYHREEPVNIPDVYNATGFDFSGTHELDARNGYRSQSILTIPMKDHESEVIGVLQLINAVDPFTGSIIPFSEANQSIVEALASQAAVALTNRNLINHLEKLFESFISLINHAIDDKSPYTGGHCNRVPDLTMMLADAVNRCTVGPLSSFSLSNEDRHELKIAGLLHDCGKITTPVHVVDKATKLETIFDRIQLIETRAEIIFRDLKLAQAKNLISDEDVSQRHQQLIDDCNFLSHCNIGVESMRDVDIERVKAIAIHYRWEDLSGKIHDFLNEEEIENLTIRAGTLTGEERLIINHHIESSINMLEKLPWPKHLKNVPEYAGGHHERMDGKGYPKGLKREEMSVQARCMGIADIFEALTAQDRPYKKGKTLSESLHILGKMKLNGHIDPDLFDIFIWEKVYEEYAQKFLEPHLIDEIDLNKVPGYSPIPAGY